MTKTINSSAGIKVRTNLKAGGLRGGNHNRVLKVRSALKAGTIIHSNHNRRILWG